jgi:hypothetical protein
MQHSMSCYASLPEPLRSAVTAGGGALGTLQVFADPAAAAAAVALHASVGCDSHELRGYQALAALAPGLARFGPTLSSCGGVSAADATQDVMVGVLAKEDSNGDIHAFCNVVRQQKTCKWDPLDFRSEERVQCDCRELACRCGIRWQKGACILCSGKLLRALSARRLLKPRSCLTSSLKTDARSQRMPSSLLLGPPALDSPDCVSASGRRE